MARKLFKVAKEFNLGKDTLLSFLENLSEEGQIEISFRGINTAIDDAAYELICEKFEREREQAEKIHRKKHQDEEGDESENAEETSAEETLAEDTPKEEAPTEEEAPKEPVEPIEPQVVEKKPIEPILPIPPKPKEKAPEKVVEKAEKTPEKKIEKNQKTEEKAKATTSTSPAPADKKPAVNASKKRKAAFEKLKRQGSNTIDLNTAVKNEAGGGYRKKRKKGQAEKQKAQATVKQTLANETVKKKRKKIKKKQEDGTEIEVNVIKINEFMSTQDLAILLDVPVPELIKKCMLDLKMMVSINQRLDLDTIRLLAEEYEYEIEEEEEFASEFLEEDIEEEVDAEQISRAPVVTIMGHVDHGKTSLLDYIRRENVVAGESGGITQHIGAYEVTLESGSHVTFLDTPGHEAFTAMRARGAQATDIVILIIAADDGVMPQTREAIDHTKAAGVPMVVAITKMDKPAANPDKIMQQLSEYDVLLEDWGGTVQCSKVSSKSGEGVDDLLEKILLEAEVLDLQASPSIRGRGVVVESQMEKGKGTVATILVQDGTMRVGDPFVVGQNSGRVKALFDERGQAKESAGPATPVQVLGLDGVPQAGDRFIIMESIQKAKEVSSKRQQLKREHDLRTMRMVTLEDISRDISVGGVQDLNIIVKGDVDGSVEALSESLIKLSHDEIRINVIRKAVGPITESDVILATASKAIIIGFHVRAIPQAKVLAEKENVEIRIYKIVYDAIDDVRDALEGMLKPEFKEEVIGEVLIQEVYKISKVGNIAGCRVSKGIIKRDSKIRIIREGIELYDGELASLKRFKDDVKEAREGFECGLQIEGYNDIKAEDIIEVYETVEIARKLEKKK